MLDKLTDFLLEYSTYTDREKHKERIRKHLEYNTCLYSLDHGVVVAICLWNVPNIYTAHICDLVIAPEWRNRDMIRTITTLGLMRFPHLKNLIFEKGYDDGRQKKPLRVIPINKIMKRSMYALSV